jgi:hypothetical protein
LQRFASGNAEDGRLFGDQLIEDEVLANRLEDSAGKPQKKDWITVVKQDIIGQINASKALKERRAVRQISSEIQDFDQKLRMKEKEIISGVTMAHVSPHDSLSDRGREISFDLILCPQRASACVNPYPAMYRIYHQ